MMIAKHIRKLEGYVPGEQPKSARVVKLNTNENPYPPSPKCTKAIADFDATRLRRYPDPDCNALRAVLAKLNGTVPERVFVGNGSDEILSLAARCFVENDEAIGSLDPSYSLYKTLAAIRDVRWVGTTIPPNHNTTIPPYHHTTIPPYHNTTLPPYHLTTQPVSLFLWTNPNAPTGEFAEPSAIAKFAAKFKGVVLIDEAYADFARENCMSLATAAKNRNVIVMRTFSKSYSLAGLRVGYCVGPEDLIAALFKAKDSYNIDALAQVVALAAAKDQKWMKANVARVRKTRKRFTQELEKRGWDVIPSESNFVFAKPPPAFAAKVVFESLKAKNIFVRYFPGPLTGERLRITIGTDGEIDTLLAALDDRFCR